MNSFGDIAGVAKNEKDRDKQARQKKKGASSGGQVAGLTAEEIKQCKVFFKTFDRDANGSVDVWELRLALEALGQNPTDVWLHEMIRELDSSGNGKLEFPEFLKALQLQKKNERKRDAEADLIDAFVAMGGEKDKSGFISAESLHKVIKDDFGLTIKIDELLDDLDTNNDGFVNFEEFKTLLG